LATKVPTHEAGDSARSVSSVDATSSLVELVNSHAVEVREPANLAACDRGEADQESAGHGADDVALPPSSSRNLHLASFGGVAPQINLSRLAALEENPGELRG